MKYLILPIALLSVAACQPRVVEKVNPINGSGIATNVPAGTISQPLLDADGNAVLDANGNPTFVQVPQATGAIRDNPNQIVLSDFSQEQQKRDREAYAAQQAALAAQRVEVTNVQVAQTPVVNVAAYARSTTNQVGQKIYSRSGNRGSCSGYASADAAQRAFLENGGPQNDSRGLDPDGDGFACDFNPSVYRSLRF